MLMDLLLILIVGLFAGTCVLGIVYFIDHPKTRRCRDCQNFRRIGRGRCTYWGNKNLKVPAHNTCQQWEGFK